MIEHFLMTVTMSMNMILIVMSPGGAKPKRRQKLAFRVFSVYETYSSYDGRRSGLSLVSRMLFQRAFRLYTANVLTTK